MHFKDFFKYCYAVVSRRKLGDFGIVDRTVLKSKFKTARDIVD
jgi:hypothetical protein